MISRREVLLAAAAYPLVRLPKPIRVCIAGTDGHVSLVTEPLASLPDVAVVAYSETAPKPALKAYRHYPDLRTMLDREKPDVLAVTTHDGDRAAAVIEGLRRGHAVFAEKPLGRTRAELDQVKAAVEEHRGRLGLMLDSRYKPHFRALRDVVRSGAIGEVAQVTGQKSYKVGADSHWKNQASSYSGTIPWVGIHMLDLMLFTSGRRFVDCAAFQHRVAFPEIGVRENTAAILFRMDNGGVATLTMDYFRPAQAPTHDDDRLRIAGTKGVAEYQLATGVTVVTNDEAPKAVPLPRPMSGFADFLNHTFNGKDSLLPLADIWTANHIVLAARDAANSRRVISL